MTCIIAHIRCLLLRSNKSRIQITPNNDIFALKMNSLTQKEELELFKCAALSSFVTVVQA